MPVETTYSHLRQELAAYLDRVIDENEIVIVRHKRRKEVALIPAEELAGLLETAHLLRSPSNAKRLASALKRAERGGGKALTTEALRKSLGLNAV